MATNRKKPDSTEADGAPLPARADHVALGAADLRRRAAACKLEGGQRCRRLEAAADLLDDPLEDVPLGTDEETSDVADAPEGADEE